MLSVALEEHWQLAVMNDVIVNYRRVKQGGMILQARSEMR